MIFRMKVVGLIVSLLSLNAGAIGGRCGGSDGPTPFVDISGQAKMVASVIPTIDLVSSFAVLEKTNQLAYVGDAGKLRIHDLSNHHELLVGDTRVVLDHFLDPEDRFLVSQVPGQLWDLMGLPLHFDLPTTSNNQYLFWNARRLYELESIQPVSETEIKISYSVLDAGAKTLAHKECAFSHDAREQYSVGQGHRYPNVFLYSTMPWGEDSRVTLYQIDLSRSGSGCAINGLGQYNDPVMGHVLSANQFAQEGMFAVRTDHPTMNMLFDSYEGCRYFNVNEAQAAFPNVQVPILLGRDRAGAVKVYSLANQKSSELFRNSSKSFSLSRDIWVTQDGKQLYSALHPSPEHSGRMVFRVDMAHLQ